MDTFPNETKRIVGEAQHGFCIELDCFDAIHSFHHMLKNSAYNRKRFPLFIHSPFNCAGLCYAGHKNRSHLFRISEQKAEVFEDYLRKLKEDK